WLLLGVGIAIAAGGVVLGKIPVEAGEVLYLALEDNQRRLKTRLQAILDEAAAPGRLHVATEWPRADQGGVELLARWLSGHAEARLLIIDTLAKFRPLLKDSGGYSADYAAIEPLQQLAAQHRVAVVLVHHHRKLHAEDWV